MVATPAYSRAETTLPSAWLSREAGPCSHELRRHLSGCTEEVHQGTGRRAAVQWHMDLEGPVSLREEVGWECEPLQRHLRIVSFEFCRSLS